MPDRYAEMGANAERIMGDYCSDDAVRERLRHIMGQVVASQRGEAAGPAVQPAPRVAEAETT